MKVVSAIMLIALFTLAVHAQKEEPKGLGFEHKTGEDVLINLQGENTDFWVVSFYQPGDNYEEVRKQIKDAMTKSFPDDTFKYGEVSLSSGYEYQKLFETLDLVGEPKRGHTTPQVLVMKNGEGYIIYGPKIGDGVVKRFSEVKEGNVFKAAPARRR